MFSGFFSPSFLAFLRSFNNRFWRFLTLSSKKNWTVKRVVIFCFCIPCQNLTFPSFFYLFGFLVSVSRAGFRRSSLSALRTISPQSCNGSPPTRPAMPSGTSCSGNLPCSGTAPRGTLRRRYMTKLFLD